MKASVPISETGTAMLAITVARRLCRKAKMTSTTMTTASTSSICTWRTDARMPSVRSVSTASCTLCGSDSCSCGSWRLMASTVAMTLAPGWRCTFRMMAGASPAAFWGEIRPLSASFMGVLLSFSIATQAPRRRFSAPSTTCATSFRRTGAPPT